MKIISVRLSEEEIEFIKSLGKGSFSDGLRKIIKSKKQKRKL